MEKTKVTKYWKEIIRRISISKNSVLLSIGGYRLNGVLLNKSQFDENGWNLISEGNIETGHRFYAMVNSDCKDIKDIRIKDVEKSQPIIMNGYSDEELRENKFGFGTVYLVEEIIRLRNAIKNHQGKTGNSLCWENDLELWKSVDSKAQYLHDKVPGKEEFLSNCEKYHESRISGLPYVEADQKTSITKDGKMIKE